MLEAFARAMTRWPAGCAPPLRVPVAERWRWTAAAEGQGERRLPLWRGGHHAGDDARSAAWAYEELTRPLGATIIAVDERGCFGAFEETLPARATLLDPRTPPTVAACDAVDDGPPWLTFTLAALLAVERVAVVLPAGAEPETVAAAGTALATLLAHAAVPVTLHGVG